MKYFIASLMLITNLVFAESYDAVLEPKSRKLLSSQMNGVLIKCPKVGTRFKRGEILLSQPIEAIEAEAEQINLNIKALSSEYSYYKKLVDQKKEQLESSLINKEEYESVAHELSKVTNKINSYKIELKKVQILLSQSVTKADLSGIVTKEFKQQGEYSKEGEACLEVIDDSVLYAIFPYEASKLKELQNKSISIRIYDQKYDGKIHLISPEVDSASGLLQIKVALSNDQLKIRSGQKCIVVLE